MWRPFYCDLARASAVILGPDPRICNRMRSLRWLDPRHEVEDDAGTERDYGQVENFYLTLDHQGTRSMSNETFANVWDAIEQDATEAENMKLRSILMMSLEQHIRAKKLTQSEAARLLNVTQPRISDLLNGKITLFSLDTLVNMLIAAGLRVEMRVSEAA